MKLNNNNKKLLGVINCKLLKLEIELQKVDKDKVEQLPSIEEVVLVTRKGH